MLKSKFAAAAISAMFAMPACAQVPIPAQQAQSRAQSQAEATAPQSAPFSPVLVANNTIFLAGHLGRIPGTRDFPAGGIGPQTTQTLENIGATLATVGTTHADLVRCQVFLADIGDFAQMNAAYRKFFPQTPPARTTVGVAGLAANASIEIECTGIVGFGGK